MKILVDLSGNLSGPNWLKRSRMLGLAIKPILESLIKVDQLYLATHHVPPLYETGVVYADEPWTDYEDFAPVPTVLSRGWGDCDDLAPWRAAELRNQGKKASIRIYWKKHPGKGKLFHILVRRPYELGEFNPAYMALPKDNTRTMIEDPSRRLGMGSLQPRFRRPVA
jgi:hypothetical protein